MRVSLNANRRQAFKIAAYIALFTVFYIVTSARGMVGAYWLVSVNAMPFLVGAAAFFEGPYWGGSLGFYGGLLMSLSSATVEGAEALIMGLFGVFCGSVAVMVMRRLPISVLSCGTGLLILRGIISATYYRLFYGLPMVEILINSGKMIVLSLLPGLIAYYAVAALHKRFKKDDEE